MIKNHMQLTWADKKELSSACVKSGGFTSLDGFTLCKMFQSYENEMQFS